ncbi:MAG: hypothetical protein DRJ38_02980 [Thermoprotei archaeon]|nr:MAG: hypothetical protein DRJ38_02980 [Thermoprotei archaeon]
MRKGSLIAIIATIIAIILYWTPLPSIGGVIIGGYPWVAPEAAKPVFIGIGVIATVALLTLSALTFYFSKKIEEIEKYSESQAEVPAPPEMEYPGDRGVSGFNSSEEVEEEYDF